MNAQHRFTTRNVRPSDDEYRAAQAVAEAHQLSINVLVRAFLRVLATNPERTLRLLRPHLAAVVADTPRGRPRAKADE